jgi:hypothetical protein
LFGSTVSLATAIVCMPFIFVALKNVMLMRRDVPSFDNPYIVEPIQAVDTTTQSQIQTVVYS